MSTAEVIYRGTTTGDLKNNVLKLLREIRRMKLEVELDTHGWCVGAPSSFLPVLHSALMEYSLPLAQWLVSQGCALYGKSDRRFLEGVYRALRDVFSYQPKLTREQFLADGYAERKVMLTCDFLLLCQAKHSQLTSGSKRRSNRTSKRHLGRDHGKGRGRESSLPEVFTVREGPGVGSVWSVDIPVLAESEPKGSRLQCDHTLPICIGGPHHTIPDLTLPIQGSFPPSPPPMSKPQYTSHEKGHDLTLTPVHSQSQTPVSPQCSPQWPHPSLGEQSPDNSEHNGDRTDVNMTTPPGKGETEGEGEEGERESWKSLPLASAEREIPLAQAESQCGQDQLRELSCRVGQLTQLVEQMAARFVLVENQLMLAQPQGAREGVRLREGCVMGRSQEGVRRDGMATSLEGVRSGMATSQEGKENKRREGGMTPVTGNGQSCSDRLQPLVASNSNGTTCEERGTVKTSLSYPVCSPSWSPDNRPHPSPHSRPHPSLQDIRPHPSLGYTPNNWRSPLQSSLTPSTEETQQLIEKLRSRAQKTKLFLQQATSSGV